MSRAASLYRLQKLDSEADHKQSRLETVRAALGETPALRRAQARVQKAAAAVQQRRTHQRDLDLTVRSIKDEIAAAEKQLYSGSIRNPKELTDLQAKAASLKRLLEHKEDDLLEAMIGLEEAEAELEAAQAHLAETEAAWQADQGVLSGEKEQLERRLAEIAREREVLLPSLRADDLTLYRSLRQRRGGVAVAMMRGGACTACGMEVPPGRLEQGHAAGLLTCGNCERILLEEEE